MTAIDWLFQKSGQVLSQLIAAIPCIPAVSAPYGFDGNKVAEFVEPDRQRIAVFGQAITLTARLTPTQNSGSFSTKSRETQYLRRLIGGKF